MRAPASPGLDHLEPAEVQTGPAPPTPPPNGWGGGGGGERRSDGGVLAVCVSRGRYRASETEARLCCDSVTTPGK